MTLLIGKSSFPLQSLAVFSWLWLGEVYNSQFFCHERLRLLCSYLLLSLSVSSIISSNLLLSPRKCSSTYLCWENLAYNRTCKEIKFTDVKEVFCHAPTHYSWENNPYSNKKQENIIFAWDWSLILFFVGYKIVCKCITKRSNAKVTLVWRPQWNRWSIDRLTFLRSRASGHLHNLFSFNFHNNMSFNWHFAKPSSWEEQVVTKIYWRRKQEWMVFIAFHNFLGWPKNMWYLGCQLTEINVLIRISHLSLRFLKRSTKKENWSLCDHLLNLLLKTLAIITIPFFLTIYRKFFRKQTYLNGNFIVLFI